MLLAGSGLVEYSRLTPQVRDQLSEIILQLVPRFDRILLDTGAGISDVVLHAVSLADEVLVVVTPEPTSMTDAYATIKVLATLQKRRHVRLVVNQVSVAGEGRTIRKQLQLVVDRFVAPQLKAEGDPVPLVARAHRRDPDRPGGARGGAPSAACCSPRCRVRRRPRRSPPSAARSRAELRSAAAGSSRTISAPWPPSAARAWVKASTSLRCTSHDLPCP